MKKWVNYLVLYAALLMSFQSSLGQEQYVKTGYFTMFYAREHVSDMPRTFYLLIEEDGTIVPLSFQEHKSTGEYSIWDFNPHDYLGKTVTIDVQASLNYNNNEFTYYEGNELQVIPRLWISKINSFVVSGQSITPPADYQYPQSDTLLIPHDVMVEEEIYENRTPTKTVQLRSYVHGEGTHASPYISADGFAGFKQAIADLPDGGTIEVASGVYKATSKKLNIPRFVSIKGVGSKKPYIILADERMWYLKGGNTIDNIDVDVSQINRSYTHEVIAIHNNARYVTIKNSKFIGNYNVDPNDGYMETGSTVIFRLYSHLQDITFEADTILFPLRSLASKGQRNQHNISFRECVFYGQGHMCITYDQTSNMSNFIVENNKFIEFSHFGIALARINDVIIRNNTFYSRNLESFNTYNQAIHIEEHTQNIIIEDNLIDVTLRNSGSGDPNSTVRSFGIIIMDSRNLTIRNNDIRYNSINFGAGSSLLSGYSEFSNNRFEDGALHIKDANKGIIIKNNEFVDPPEYALNLYSTKPMLQPYGWHRIESNLFRGMEGKQALNIKAQLFDVSITNNSFEGCSQSSSSIQLYEGSESLEIRANTFYGLNSEKAFSVVGDLPNADTINKYLLENTFLSECAPDSDYDGVIDENDSCPNTTPGIQVDESGCSLDEDEDGVLNEADNCPGTIPGATVNESGCSIDDDSDGVLNENDHCPNTGPGEITDSKGCSLVGYSVILNVKDKTNETPIEGATLILNSENATSNVLGRTAFNQVLAGTYFVSIEHPYYAGVDTTEVFGNIEKDIVLTKTYKDVRVNVTKNGNIFADATVTIAGTSQQTNAEGYTTFLRLNIDSTYTYSVSEADEVLKEGSFSVAEGIEVNIAVEVSVINSKNSVSVLQIFPNPAKNELYVRGLKASSEYTVYNILGSKLLQDKTENGRINVACLKSGIYYIQVKNETWKFMKY